jgi:hypothetical protein
MIWANLVQLDAFCQNLDVFPVLGTPGELASTILPVDKEAVRGYLDLMRMVDIGKWLRRELTDLHRPPKTS